MYFENIFPALNIRFISVIENIDSFENPDSKDNLIVPLKNLLNDAYAKDISKKVRSGSCTNHSIRKDKLVGLVIEELNKKFKRNKIDTLTKDILLKDINSIIISQDGEVTINFK